MNTEIHNPDNIQSPGEGYRFLYKGETRADATHYWLKEAGEWETMETWKTGPLYDVTYRTDKPVPHIPTPGFVSGKAPVPPEAIEHGAPSVGVPGIYPAKDNAQWINPDVVDTTLDDRAKTYGRFIDNAAVAQKLKGVIAQALIERDKVLPDDLAECLDMVCSKMARIVSGGEDGWHDQLLDIEGYTRLVRQRLEGYAR